VAGASILVFGISWTLFEFATVAANGIFGALINDVVPRSLLGRFFGLFRALSLIAGIIFNLWLIGKAQVHYVSAFLSVSALYGVGFAMMCLKVKEGDYPPPPPPSTTYNPISRFVEAIQIYFKECFTNPYYFWVFMAMNLGNLAFIPVNGFSVYYAQSLNMSMATYGKYIGWTYVISLGLAYPLGILSDRFHPLRMSLVSQALYAVCSLWGAKYALGSGSFGIALVAHGVLSGCYFTTSASLGQRLFPHSRFAQFASAQIMIQALSTLALGPILGRILDRSGHIYRYTFVGGLLLSVLAVLFLLIVNQEFVKLGGSKHYVAPE
jgi:hypothetical protein